VGLSIIDLEKVFNVQPAHGLSNYNKSHPHLPAELAENGRP
jgi:hypothetical protein